MNKIVQKLEVVQKVLKPITDHMGWPVDRNTTVTLANFFELRETTAYEMEIEPRPLELKQDGITI